MVEYTCPTVPNIATVIHEQNLLLRHDTGTPGAVHINLDALILSNPITVRISFSCSRHTGLIPLSQNPIAHFS
jgi:hypothetical protein